MYENSLLIQVCGSELPGMTKQYLTELIESADDLILNKTPSKCAECPKLASCKEKALGVKAAAVKLTNYIEEYENTVNSIKKGVCK